MVWRTGKITPMRTPERNETAIRIGMVIASTAMSAPVKAARDNCAISAAIITFLRSARSASDPLRTGTKSMGIMPRAKTAVTRIGEGVRSRARKARATCCIWNDPKLKNVASQK